MYELDLKNYEGFNKAGKKDSLKMLFNATKPNQIWVNDVTYLIFGSKFYYICAIIDLYARKAVACKISKKHTTQLITSTFKETYKHRQPAEQLTFPSNRESQYISY